MARQGLIQSNDRKKRLCERFMEKRKSLKALIMDRTLPLEQRFQASMALAKLPRSSSPVRIRSRCIETGRARAVFSFCGLARVALRRHAVQGRMPGVRKSSW